MKRRAVGNRLEGPRPPRRRATRPSGPARRNRTASAATGGSQTTAGDGLEVEVGKGGAGTASAWPPETMSASCPVNCPPCSQLGYNPPPTSSDPLVPCAKCGWPDSEVPHLQLAHLATRAEMVRRQGWADLTDPQLTASRWRGCRPRRTIASPGEPGFQRRWNWRERSGGGRGRGRDRAEPGLARATPLRGGHQDILRPPVRRGGGRRGHGGGSGGGSAGVDPLWSGGPACCTSTPSRASFSWAARSSHILTLAMSRAWSIASASSGLTLLSNLTPRGMGRMVSRAADVR